MKFGKMLVRMGSCENPGVFSMHEGHMENVEYILVT